MEKDSETNLHISRNWVEPYVCRLFIIANLFKVLNQHFFTQMIYTHHKLLSLLKEDANEGFRESVPKMCHFGKGDYVELKTIETLKAHEKLCPSIHYPEKVSIRVFLE